MNRDLILAASGGGVVIPSTVTTYDPYFNSTTLLLNGEGANPSFSDDASANKFLLSPFGTVKSDTSQPFQEGYYSGLFNGSTDCLNTPSGSAFAFGTNDFTVECWMFVTYPLGTTGQGRGVLTSNRSAASSNTSLVLQHYNSKILFGTPSTDLITGAITLTTNTWIHIAVSRASGTLRLFVNGVLDISVPSNTTNFSDTNAFAIGADGLYTGYYFTGYISNARLVKGVAVYTGAFNPPTAPLTITQSSGTNISAITGTQTSLLTLQSNRFKDQTAANLAITTAGTPAIKTLQPFTLPTTWATYGSGFFNGTTDYLTAPSNAAFAVGTVFTVELWVWPTTTTNMLTLGSFQMGWNGASQWGVATAGVSWDVTTATMPTQSAWNHVAVVRTGTGTNQTTIYLNGVSVAVGTHTPALTTSVIAYIGSGPSGTSTLGGYISNLRIVKGTAVYTANFTPPTAPLTITQSAGTNISAITGTQTSLLALQYKQGSNNNGFQDSSQNNFLITRNGTPTQGTFTPFSQTGWGGFFNGSTDYLTTAASATLGFGTGDFTVELWINFSATAGRQDLIWWGPAVNARGGISWNIAAGSLVYYIEPSPGNAISAAWTPIVGTWYHIALVRSSGTSKLYIGGTQVGSSYTDSKDYSTGASTYVIVGKDSNVAGTAYFNGYMSNVRIVKGTAVYTGNFTPPTAPLTAITNTSLLTLQNNRFKDNSANAFAITVAGAPSIQAFSPFLPTAAYDAATNGGTVYFNGTTDSLSAPANAAFSFTGDFTIEAWVYYTSVATESDIASNYVSNVATDWTIVKPAANTFQWYPSSAASFINSGITPIVGAWYHIAAVRSGTTCSLYVNGVSRGTPLTFSGTLGDAVKAVRVGARSASNYFPGYISGARIVKGTAVYTANFTPPTAPLTAITNTSLLLSGTNAGIIDATSKNNVTTIGDSRAVTARAKNTGGSLYFDGTGDYITLPATTNVTTSGDFTFEFWVYTITGATTQCHYAVLGGNSATADFLQVYKSTTGYLNFISATSATVNDITITSSVFMPLNSWVHVAVVRYGNIYDLYQDGVKCGTTVTSAAVRYTAGTVHSLGGQLATATWGSFFNGYIDDVRFTKYARYVGVFTPPIRTLEYSTTTTIAAVTVDPYFNSTVLLLNSDYTTGAQNNIFIDSSSNNFPITRSGTGTTQGTFTPFSQTGWGGYFNGSSYLSVPDNAALEFGTNSITLECWFYMTGTSGYLFDKNNSGTGAVAGFSLFVSTTAITWYYDAVNNGYVISPITTTVVQNQWNHIALVRSVSGTTANAVFLNGVRVGTSATATAFPDNTQNFRIGAAFLSNSIYGAFTGFVSNVRLLNGAAVYDPSLTTLTVPTAPLTAITNTTLLTLQSNYFKDNSANALIITPSGTTSIQAFSPFAPTAAYSAATNGGAMYFHTTASNWVSFPLNTTALALSNSDFTFEAWVYRSSGTGTASIFIGQANLTTVPGSSWAFYVSSASTSDLYMGATPFSITSPNPVLSSWAHVAWVRTGGVYSSYLNGTRVGTLSTLGTNSVNTGNTTYPTAIGQSANGTNPFNGCISDARLIKGSGGYNANNSTITIPTAPLTAITNTSLLLSGTNAGIIDATAKSILQVGQNTRVSGEIKKFGTGSAVFDGAGGLYVFGPTASNCVLNAGDFTIEAWVYPTLSQAGSIVSKGTATLGWTLGLNATLYPTATLGSTTITSPAAVSVSVWSHIALVRTGTTTDNIKLYINGYLRVASTAAITTNFNEVDHVYVGANRTGAGYFSGYIDDLRITKYARYLSPFTSPPSSVFTPPTSAAPKQ